MCTERRVLCFKHVPRHVRHGYDHGRSGEARERVGGRAFWINAQGLLNVRDCSVEFAQIAIGLCLVHPHGSPGSRMGFRLLKGV